MKIPVLIAIMIAFILTACAALAAPVAPTALPAATATASPTATVAPQPVDPGAPTAIPATPGPYDKYTIAYLRSRTYGGGQVQVLGGAAQFSNFSRYLISYPSDGITIAGFMDVPNGLGPFPVVIALHGYVNPFGYNTLDYTTKYADAMAAQGFLVLHPNMRNFPPSGNGDDLFRVGMTTDVLNLIAIVKATAGQNGPLEAADPQRIGLWGHGMGAAIATRVMTVSPDIKAAVLYSPVSGDDLKNYQTAGIWAANPQANPESAVPAQDYPFISPMYFYQYIQAAVSIHQGMADSLIPVRWTQDTCDQLQELGKTVQCHYYNNEGNVFSGNEDKSFIRVSIQFLDQYLRGS